MIVFITGVAGFIGSHLAERLIARGDRVIGLDNFDNFYSPALKHRNLALLRSSRNFRFVEGDVRDEAALARGLGGDSGKPEVVVHLAALAGVQPSLQRPVHTYDVNVMGTCGLIEACRKSGVQRLVFASSSSVYGGDTPLPFKEDAPCGLPLSPYASTKRAGELMVANAQLLYGWSTTCLRFFTVYGPRQRPDLAIQKFTRLIARGEAIELYGDGTALRDYTFIDDIIDGVVAALDQQSRQARPVARIYNLGGGQTTPLSRVVALIGDALGRRPIISFRPEQAGDMRRTQADLSASSKDLGYAPRVGIAAGIEHFVDWWQVEARRSAA